MPTVRTNGAMVRSVHFTKSIVPWIVEVGYVSTTVRRIHCWFVSRLLFRRTTPPPPPPPTLLLPLLLVFLLRALARRRVVYRSLACHSQVVGCGVLVRHWAHYHGPVICRLLRAAAGLAHCFAHHLRSEEEEVVVLVVLVVLVVVEEEEEEARKVQGTGNPKVVKSIEPAATVTPTSRRTSRVRLATDALDASKWQTTSASIPAPQVARGESYVSEGTVE